MDWRVSEIYELIRLYKLDVCLWDYHDSDYKNQTIRNKAWAKLAKHFHKEVDDVKKKIKNLRNSYLAEKKKVNKMNNRKIPYEPHLYYYNLMAFLDPVQIARIIPEKEEDRLTNVRPTTTISYKGTLEAPKSKRSESSDNSIELVEEEEAEVEVQEQEQEQVQELEEEEEEQQQQDEDDAIITSTMHSSFTDSPKITSRIQQKSVKLLPEPHIPNSTRQNVIAQRPMPSKEDTFCAMICSELMLLKSEETYDNVTTEIFIALKNAKATDRKISNNL